MGCGNSKKSDPSTNLVAHRLNDNTRFPKQNEFLSSKHDAETQNNIKEIIEEPLKGGATLDSLFEEDVEDVSSRA